MPITPFHIIAVAPIKSFFPKYFSWSVFALTNIIIDTEVLYYLLTTNIPSHKFFHTIIGASIIAIICSTLGKPVCEFGLRIWNDNLQNEKTMKNLVWLKTNKKITFVSSWCGAFTAAYLHLLLDSFVHFDIAPLAPFTNQNYFLDMISIQNIYYICLGCFLIGSFIFFLKLINRKS
mgnify:CR=1 FL=1